SISALRLRSVRFGLHKFSLVNYNALSVSDARSRSFEANLLTDRLIKTFGVHNQLPAIHRICA
ncbi:hypothetical protein, partial [Xenorhabdus sp. GDc328]|uniref:hypothetical protein n=1 Tax=Xenorhabdus sp. GDc328 TaxID=742178 RepID=UPI001F1D3109